MSHTDTQLIVDLARNVAGAATLEGAAESLCAIGEAIEARQVTFVSDYASGGVLHANISGRLGTYFMWDRTVIQSWLSRSLYLISPIGSRCRVDEQPFVWAAKDMLDKIPLRGRALRVQWHFNLERGIVAGITAPVHRPLGRVGSVSWMTDCEDHQLDGVVADCGPLLSMAAQSFIQAVFRANNELPAAAPSTRTQFDEAGDLTALELECLQWVALGKTDDEIAEIIGRSRAAVRFRLKCAMAKLGSTSRAQAVAVCSQLGLLHPLVKA